MTLPQRLYLLLLQDALHDPAPLPFLVRRPARDLVAVCIVICACTVAALVAVGIGG